MKKSLLALVGLSGATSAFAAVLPNPLFSDHAVLQADQPVAVWGRADDGERVEVSFDGAKVATVASGGRWKVTLPAHNAGGPFELRIQGTNTIVVKDVLVGEVWLAGGQSNMERQLGPRPPQKPIVGWEAAAARANYPEFRQFQVPNRLANHEEESADGKWIVCTPKTAADFSAVGFFFGEAVLHSQKRPVGLLFSTWGGTPAEAWMSRSGLEAIPEYRGKLAVRDEALKDEAGARRRFEKDWEDWYARNDAGSRVTPWYSPSLDETSWENQSLPGYFEDAGLPDYDGVVWYRNTFQLDGGKPETMVLRLGPIDDNDTVWINGHKVGHTENYATPRVYRVPAEVLLPGKNVIAVRVADTGGNGGFYAADGVMRLEKLSEPLAGVSLQGMWKRKVGGRMNYNEALPTDFFTGSPGLPGVLYNGMIAPVVGYGIRGAIWYQGEANVGREREYRSLFPGLINDWRARWGQGDFPFLFVQIAPFRGMTPEIREAQFLSLGVVPKTAMAVTLDVGDADDIHPANKEPVGLRLAAAARALAYGSAEEYSGPHYTGATFEKDRAVLTFTHLGGGLAVHGTKLEGFVGLDQTGAVVDVEARVEGATVVVRSVKGTTLKAVRYGWANVPVGNLFNQAGFPASPFRTDTP